MKISPVSSTANTVGAVSGADAQTSRVQSVRSLRMATNATPGAEQAPQSPESAVLPTQDASSEASEATNQPLSPQAAALARARRALQQERKAFEAEKEALKAQSSTQEDMIPKARLKAETLRVLQEAGITYDDLTQAILADQGGNSSQIRDLEKKIEAIQQGFDTKLTERDQQARTQVLSEMKRDATLLSAQGEDFELVRETKSIPQVMALIERTYDTTGEVLDVREALKLVEDELIKESLKLAGLGKVKNQLAPPPPAQQPRPGMRTLSNRDTATAPLSAKQRALAAFNGTLKK